MTSDTAHVTQVAGRAVPTSVRRTRPSPGLGSLLAMFAAAPFAIVGVLLLAAPAVALVLCFALLLALSGAVNMLVTTMIDREDGGDDGGR